MGIPHPNIHLPQAHCSGHSGSEQGIVLNTSTIRLEQFIQQQMQLTVQSGLLLLPELAAAPTSGGADAASSRFSTSRPGSVNTQVVFTQFTAQKKVSRPTLTVCITQQPPTPPTSLSTGAPSLQSPDPGLVGRPRGAMGRRARPPGLHSHGETDTQTGKYEADFQARK